MPSFDERTLLPSIISRITSLILLESTLDVWLMVRFIGLKYFMCLAFVGLRHKGNEVKLY